MISRIRIFKYIEKKYGVKPDYPFESDPSLPIFRHRDNRKWFALIMDVDRARLGLPGEGSVDIINVKVSDPLLTDILVQQEGYVRAYHMNRRHWISILLDGTAAFEDICRLIDESFDVTASKAKRKQL